MDDMVTNSPEPPENIELDDTAQNDENGQPGRLHPEQDLSHIFKVGEAQGAFCSHDSLVFIVLFFFKFTKSQYRIKCNCLISAGQNVKPLSYCLQSIQGVLTDLTMDELFSFKMWLFQSQKEKSLQQVMEGDILDFVDKMLEVFGKKP